MSSYFDGLTGTEWEDFCEIMLRQHFGAKNFYSVPAEDSGDFGIDFFTVDGTIFQCYYPKQGVTMDEYKKKIQKKINDDLKKLKEKEPGIAAVLDDIKINHWVILTPENKSKDLIPYCARKKKETIKESISFIDGNNFSVKIETADSYPAARDFALGLSKKLINIPLADITTQEIQSWTTNNSQFSKNITRKSDVFLGNESQRFQETVTKRYIQIEKFLDQLRADFPDLHEQVEGSARAQLQEVAQDSIFFTRDKEFIQKTIEKNRAAFTKHSEYFCDQNMQSLSMGYLSKWIAECYMDFK